MRIRRRIHPEIDVESPAFIVVDKFGGLAKFCEISGYARSTVYDWLRKGLIPSDKHEPILALAVEHRKTVRRADFVREPMRIAS